MTHGTQLDAHPQYRGATLPPGMTTACLHELGDLISAYERDDLKPANNDDYVCAGRCAIMAFQIVDRHLSGSKQPDEQSPAPAAPDTGKDIGPPVSSRHSTRFKKPLSDESQQ